MTMQDRIKASLQRKSDNVEISPEFRAAVAEITAQSAVMFEASKLDFDQSVEKCLALAGQVKSLENRQTGLKVHHSALLLAAFSGDASEKGIPELQVAAADMDRKQNVLQKSSVQVLDFGFILSLVNNPDQDALREIYSSSDFDAAAAQKLRGEWNVVLNSPEEFTGNGIGTGISAGTGTGSGKGKVTRVLDRVSGITVMASGPTRNFTILNTYFQFANKKLAALTSYRDMVKNHMVERGERPYATLGESENMGRQDIRYREISDESAVAWARENGDVVAKMGIDAIPDENIAGFSDRVMGRLPMLSQSAQQGVVDALIRESTSKSTEAREIEEEMPNSLGMR